MKFKMRIFKEVVDEVYEFEDDAELDNDDLSALVTDCWRYHDAESLPDKTEEEQREMIKDFLLFDGKELSEGTHWVWLKPKYKKLAQEKY